MCIGISHCGHSPSTERLGPGHHLASGDHMSTARRGRTSFRHPCTINAKYFRSFFPLCNFLFLCKLIFYLNQFPFFNSGFSIISCLVSPLVSSLPSLSCSLFCEQLCNTELFPNALRYLYSLEGTQGATLENREER